ncbi:MAG: hypothetical protein ACPGVB_08785 [Chitinophagales bacterium]
MDDFFALLAFFTFIFVVFPFILIFILFRRTKRQAKYISTLQTHLEELAFRLKILEKGKVAKQADFIESKLEQELQPKTVSIETALQKPIEEKPIIPDIVPELESIEMAETSVITPPPIEKTEQTADIPFVKMVKRQAIKVEEEPTEKEENPQKENSLWARLEEQFADNWTGIIGAILLVIGVGFGGTYAALSVEPMIRFFLISAIAATLLAAYYYLNRLPEWQKMASWLRSAGGAIFLFACFGSGGVQGLQWIDNSLWALILLLIGVAVNLYLAWIGGKQVFSSLHIVLSLLALGLAPASDLGWGIGIGITLFSILLAYKPEKWDWHILVTIIAFFFFHLQWYFYFEDNLQFTSTKHLFGIIGIVLVGALVVVIHYRELYVTTKLEALPLSVHLLNWVFIGIGLLVHSMGGQWRIIFITLAAVIAFFLARRAKHLGISWLYHTDTIVSQILAFIAILALEAWEVNPLIISTVMLIEVLGFTALMLWEKERWLYTIGMWIFAATGLAFLYFAILPFQYGGFGYENTFPQLQIGLSGLVTLVAITVFHVHLIRQKSTLSFSVLGGNLITGTYISAWILVLFLHYFNHVWALYLVVGVTVFYLWLRQRLQSEGLLYSLALLVAGLHGLVWFQLIEVKSFELSAQILYAAPLLLASFAAAVLSYDKLSNNHYQWFGIYLFAAHLGALVFWLTQYSSLLIAGVAWLILSVVALELANYFRKKHGSEIANLGYTDRYLLHVGYAFIAAFLIRHLMVHLQVEQYIGFIKIRMLIELLAIGVFGYWASYKKPESEPFYKSWTHFHPLFLELILLFVVTILSVEMNTIWFPILWVMAAYWTLAFGVRFEYLARLKFYSLLFLYASIFHLVFVSANYITPSLAWQDQAWWTGLIAIALQFGFVAYFYPHRQLEKLNFPPFLMGGMRWLADKIRPLIVPFLVYPVFIGVGIFLFWSFDKAILTFLWVVECLGLFVLSIILRDKYFRYVALGGVVICVGRLIFYDLAQTNWLTRAMVFVGTGVVMLVMNSIYNKYKGRFE